MILNIWIILIMFILLVILILIIILISIIIIITWQQNGVIFKASLVTLKRHSFESHLLHFSFNFNNNCHIIYNNCQL